MNTSFPLFAVLVFGASLFQPGCGFGAPGLVLELPGEAVMTGQVTTPLTSLRLPNGPFANDVLPTVLIEGAMDQTAWRSTLVQVSTLAIARSLRTQIQAAGYSVEFECETVACGGFDFRFGAQVLPEPIMHIDLGDFRYLLATRKGEVPETLALMISRSATEGFVQLTRVGGAQSAITAQSNGVILAQANSAVAQVTAPATAMPPAAPAVEPGSPTIAATLDQGLSAVLEDLDFSSGSSVLTIGDYQSLADLALWMKAHPGQQIMIVGHTDSSGSARANLTLSKMRAESVRQQLMFQYGAASKQVTADGAGQLAPRATNQTPEGRAKNRRVEVIVTSTDLQAP